MRVRSLYGLYNTVTLGVSGTAHACLQGAVGRSSAGCSRSTSRRCARRPHRCAGRGGLEAGRLKAAFAGLKDLVARLARRSAGPTRRRRGAAASLAHRASRSTAASAAPSPLAFARRKLDESAQLYARGEREAARQAAIAAYLEGFELIENSLDNVDAPLRQRSRARNDGAAQPPSAAASRADAVQAQVARLHGLIERAHDKLGGEGLVAGHRVLQFAVDPAARRARSHPGAGGDHRVRAQDRPARGDAVDPRGLARRGGARRR